MSTVSTASAAFYQFFRDREGSAAARQASDGDGPAQAATATAIDPGDDAQSSGDGRLPASTALTPDQVRSHLKTLIAGQIDSGKLTSDQGATLQQALGPQPAQDATGAQVPAPTATSDGLASQDQFAGAEPVDAYKPSEVLAAFIGNLQRSQPAGASYGSTGAAPARNARSQVLDFST